MGWLASLIVFLLLASIIAGQSSAPSGTTGSQKCDDCKKDFAWYNNLPWWKKTAFSAWWLARKAACIAAGC